MKRILVYSLSDWIRGVSFLAAICVVVIHANAIGRAVDPPLWMVNLHRIVCKEMTSWAVPWFFAVSGFFFARGYCAASVPYPKFLRKKLHTLVVPYVVWNVAVAILTLPLIILANHISSRCLLERSVLQDLSAFSLIDNLFAIVRYDPLQDGPLWFVRSLIILFMIAPLFRLFYKLKCAWILFLLGVYGVISLNLVSVFGIQFMAGKSSWFLIGFAVAVYWPFEDIAKQRQGQHGKIVEFFLDISFWIYCSHFVFVCYIHAVWHIVFGRGAFSIALLTPFSACGALLMSIMSAALIKRHWPGVYGLLVGGRGAGCSAVKGRKTWQALGRVDHGLLASK